MKGQSLRERYPRALVTGASGGIGAAIARCLLDEGVQVWGTARDPARLPALPGLRPVTLDLADAVGAERSFLDAQHEAGGGFDLLVNNAGYGVFGPFDTRPFSEWETQFDVLLVQAMRLCSLAMPAMKAKGRGAVVNVTSLAVEFPIPGMGGYNAAKAGLSAWTLSLAHELRDTGVLAVDLRPGDIRTDFNRAVAGAAPVDPRWARVWRRFETLHDVAPGPDIVARDLVRALRAGRSGVVRSGSFFQARLAPFLARFSTGRLARRVQARYFDLR